MKVAVLIFGGALLFLPAWLAQTAQNKPLTTGEFRRLMQTVAEGWNEGNARKAADCFAVNAIYTEPPAKQVYQGRDALFKFFGGTAGRKQPMQMAWHHLVFDEQTQIGAGEFTFAYGKSRVHGVVMIKITERLISNWREYFYESDLEWRKFIGENNF